MQISSGRVAAQRDVAYSPVHEPAIAGLGILDGRRKRMFRCESVIGYECRFPGSQGDVARQVAECFGCSPIEPAAVQVKDCPSFAGPRRLGPPAGNPSDGVLLKSIAFRGFEPSMMLLSGARPLIPSSFPFMPATAQRKAAMASSSSDVRDGRTSRGHLPGCSRV